MDHRTTVDETSAQPEGNWTFYDARFATDENVGSFFERRPSTGAVAGT